MNSPNPDTCSQIREQLAQGHPTGALAGHLTACPDCRAFAALEKGLLHLAQSQPAPTAPTGLADAILAAPPPPKPGADRALLKRLAFRVLVDPLLLAEQGLHDTGARMRFRLRRHLHALGEALGAQLSGLAQRLADPFVLTARALKPSLVSAAHYFKQGD
ncbi:MAG: hypothetical protein GKR89_01555 [Candidatus Latescibacteria bacterium]|nr:hypothetical protein [Candidatus Latescibacterota bacterium]